MTRKRTSAAIASSDSILIYATQDVTAREERGILEGVGKQLGKTVEMSSERLAEAFSTFSERFAKAIAAMGDSAGPFTLDEIKVSVELGLNGEMKLLGNGVTASGGSGLELTFKRKTISPAAR